EAIAAAREEPQQWSVAVPRVLRQSLPAQLRGCARLRHRPVIASVARLRSRAAEPACRMTPAPLCRSSLPDLLPLLSDRGDPPLATERAPGKARARPRATAAK